MPPPRKPQRPSTTGTPPVVLVKWYDVAKWLLERVDSFPKNQRFIFGQRIASDALDILALLVEASYRRDKVALLEDANRRLEVLRWLLRMATDRKVLTGRQYQYICEQLAVCGRKARSGRTFCSQVPCGLHTSQIKPTPGNTQFVSLGVELFQVANGFHVI